MANAKLGRPGGSPSQKSVHRPLYSQSPYRVGSGPFGPPISRGFGAAGRGAWDGVGGRGSAGSRGFSLIARIWDTISLAQPAIRLWTGGCGVC